MQFNGRLRASKFWLEWNACNGSGFSCLTFHWRLTWYSLAKFISENEKVSSIMKIIWRFLLLSSCSCFAKNPLYLPIFFPYLKFNKYFPFDENIVPTKIRSPQKALKPVKIDKINGIENSRCFGRNGKYACLSGNVSVEWVVTLIFLPGIFGFCW